MHPKNRTKLANRVIKAAEAALAAQHYAAPVDVLVGLGWLDGGTVKRWRQGQVDYLERVVQTNLSRISEAMKLFRRFSRSRHRYERQGLLVELHALTQAQRVLQAQAVGPVTILDSEPRRASIEHESTHDEP